MRLAIDAMGTDHSYMTILEGVRQFVSKNKDAQVILVGKQEELAQGLAQLELANCGQIEIEPASQVIEMQDKIGALREKKDSSIARTVELVKSGRADGMVALGNTMATVAMSRLGLGHLPGIHRAGIAVPMPAKHGVCVVIDMGANVSVKPRHLLTYGIMASSYCELVLGTKHPKVGLLNVGEEEAKGNAVLKEAYGQLQVAPINFIGNVEGGDIFNGECDVVVCDGFVGNVILKATETLASAFASILKNALNASFLTKIGAVLVRSAFMEVKRKANYDQYGGAPLLGVKGICIIGHGRSNATAVMNALRVAGDSVSVGLLDRINAALATMS